MVVQTGILYYLFSMDCVSGVMDVGQYSAPVHWIDVARRYLMGTKQEFTIDRGGRLERTIVGKNGQAHVRVATERGKDGHFTNEGQYRRAVEKAVDENKK